MPTPWPMPTRSRSSRRATPAALAAFAALVGEFPADALAQYHLRRLLNGGERNADRNGIGPSAAGH